ncbi:hypothetical protein [Kingella oralis]|uniref:hypothetical protein n=1 Tax=Kingella oralis TaxID=505 RepID=UPI002D806B2D|nr:hypothetical protein [Kingella oralis]
MFHQTFGGEPSPFYFRFQAADDLSQRTACQQAVGGASDGFRLPNICARVPAFQRQPENMVRRSENPNSNSEVGCMALPCTLFPIQLIACVPMAHILGAWFSGCLLLARLGSLKSEYSRI